MGPVAKLAALEAKARARGRVVAVIPRLEAAAAACLPYWRDHYCALPNALLRSAAFAAIGKGQRVLLSGALIESQTGIGVLHDGEQLDQSDLDVWIAQLQLLRGQPLNQGLKTSAYALLQALDISDTGPNRSSLRRRLLRLSSGELSVRTPSSMYVGRLAETELLNCSRHSVLLRLSPAITTIFTQNQYTLINMAVRRTLRGSPLAQWLHGYYSTHAAPFPVRIGFLHRLSGSTTTSKAKFLQLLRRALDRLASASAAHDEPFSYQIDGDRVVVSRLPSKSQARHLAARAKNTVATGRNAVTAGGYSRYSR